MSKPSALPIWDSGNVNTSPTTGGHQTSGFANGEIPTAAEINYFWLLLCTWIAWILNNVATISRARTPPTIVTSSTNVTLQVASLSGSNSTVCYATSSAAPSGSFNLDLDIPQGYKLASLTVRVYGPTGNGFNLGIESYSDGGTVPATLASMTGVPGGGTTSWGSDHTFNFAAASAAQSFTAASGGIYTRSTGSFVTDGFFVGQAVQWSGFTNSGNNVAGVISAVSALSMTISTTGQTSETAVAASVTNTMPTTDGTFIPQLTVTGFGSTASTTALSYLRYTVAPQ
ncbi:MAG TPA: hypothetical protein VGG74_21330 [Kofleriaceae bacterium]|jgi:hypothetical protein